MKKHFLVTLGLLSTFLLFGQFSAQEFSRTGNIPDLISFQGRLTDSVGSPINDEIAIRFSVYNTDTGGTALWFEDRTVAVSNGLFQINLGDLTPLTETYFGSQTRWLGVKIGTDNEMTPRIRIVSAPYALNALESDPTWSGDADSTGEIGRTGNVGIGIQEPLFPLHISGSGSAELQSIYNYEDQPSSISFGTFYKTWRIGQNKPPDLPTFLDGFFIYDVSLGHTRLHISSVGNVGIGSINPASKLDVDGQIRIRGGNPGEGRVLTSNATGVATWEEAAPIVESDPTWGGDASTTGDIGRTGNVGIGTITPGAKLDVSGSDALINSLTVGRGSGSILTNSVLGYQALHNNTGGIYNTVSGYRALHFNNTGSYNTASGYGALYYNIAHSNTATGYLALHNNNSTSATRNTAIGKSSLYTNTTGNCNTALGDNAGNYGYSNQYGTFIGLEATALNDNLTNITCLGYNAKVYQSNHVRIGNSSVESIGGYAYWSYFSDGRYKRNIEENVIGLDFIMKLRPITYNLDVNQLARDLKEDQRIDEDGLPYMAEPSDIDVQARNQKSLKRTSGFIGQEVESAALDCGFEFSGVNIPKNSNEFYSINYAEFVVPLVKAVQEQQEIIETQQKQIEELLQRIIVLENR